MIIGQTTEKEGTVSVVILNIVFLWNINEWNETSSNLQNNLNKSRENKLAVEAFIVYLVSEILYLTNRKEKLSVQLIVFGGKSIIVYLLAFKL